MATKTVVVCDICGKPAAKQRLVDVCVKHEGEDVEKTTPCIYCGKPFASRSMGQHVRWSHPKKGAKT